MVCFCLIPTLIFGQQRAISQLDDSQRQKTEIRETKLPLLSSESLKNIDSKDVIFYEDFDGSFPDGWQNIVVSGPDDFPGWEWTDTGGAFGGQLLSTTADNGYMILDSDANGASGFPEEANLISIAIDCSDATENIFLSLEHWARTFGAADISIFISTDDFANETLLYNWSEGDVNTSNGPNPVVSLFDITSIAQGQSNVKIKFNWIGEYDYWWLVDDVTIFEASAFSLTMLDPIGMGEVLPAPGLYEYALNTVVPLSATPALGYTFDLWNQGDVADVNASITTIEMDDNKTVQATFTELSLDLLWHQYTYGGNANNSAVIDENTEYEVADNFSNSAIESITKVMVQGLPVGVTLGAERDLTLRFYAPNKAGEPDWENPVSTQTITAKAYFVEPLSWNPSYSVFKYELDLLTPVDLQEGWISVQADDTGSFFWLSADDGVGDGDSWQRIVNEDGDPNENLTHDFMLEVWGQEAEVVPDCVAYLTPDDEELNQPIDLTFSWQTSPNATGYMFYLGETLPANGLDLGDATSYDAVLEYSTTYLWKVVPYNTYGSAENCPVYSFSTGDDPTQVLPWSEDFTGIDEDAIPYGWDKTHPNWGVVEGEQAGGTSPEMRFNWSPSATDVFKLISPPLQSTAKADYRLVFLHFIDFYDTPATYKVQYSSDGETWEDIWEAVDPDANVGPEYVFVDLGEIDDIFYLAWVYDGNSFNTNGWYIDDIQVEEAPTEPVFSIVPDPLEEALDFGNTPIGEQSDAQNFTIQNTGAGNLAIERIMLDGGDTGEFILTGAPDEDVFLSTGETFSFNVAFAPITEGLKETNLLILYADGEPEQSYSLTLRGTGIEPPAGSTCDNPYLLTLPVIDYIDNTEAYGDNYSSSWIDPSSSYLNGNDFVAQFTLSEVGYLSGSVVGEWTGVIILEDCPDPDAPAEVLALGTGSDGGSFTDVIFQPGTYFAIVSTFPLPEFTDFTLNLSFEPLPDCVAPNNLTATDITSTSATLGWTALGSVTSWNIEWGLSGFVPGEATLVEGVDNPYVLTGLDPATSYDFYVQSICNGETSEWSGPFTFTTLCDVLALIDEDFELPEFPPLCWSLVSGSGNWARSTLASGYDVGEASARANFYSISGSVPFDMVTPEFAISSAKLTFDYAYATYVSEVDMLIILYSTDGGDSWELIEELEGGLDGPLNTGGASSSSFVPNEDQWATLSYDLPEGTNKVKFQGISAFGNNLYLDNIIIEESGDEGITLDLKVILEGAYSPDLTELMLTQINDVLPLEQPFAPELPYFGNNNPVWYYEGDEAIAEVPDNVVDWVLVELRDAAAPSEAYTNTVVARKAALLLNTGEIVSADLNLPVFDVEISEGLYVVVYHRNHLAVMSAEALTEEDGTYSWDFTQAMNKAYRPQTKSSYGDGHKELGDGVFGMYGGDGDANGQIQAQDKNNVWNLQSGLAGYYPADFDLNGQVQAQDKNNIWNPNSGNGSAVPGDAK